MTPPRTVLDDLPFCLAQASLVFRRFSDLTLRATGVDGQAPGLATVLHTLDEFGESPVSLLVDQSRLPNGTVTGLLDTLEDDGLIRRTRNPEDGRSWIVALTPKGNRACGKLRRRHGRVMAVFGDALSKAEARRLATLLRKLSSHLQAYTGSHEVRSRSRKRVHRGNPNATAGSPRPSR